MAEGPPNAWRRQSLHILGLWAVAVVQPLLDLLGKNPTFFIAHRTDRLDLVAFVLALVLLVPGTIAILLWLLHRVGARTAGDATATGLVGVLVLAVAMLAIKQAGAQTAIIAIPLAAVAALFAAWVYRRTSVAKTFASALSLSALLVPLLFVAQPGIRPLLTSPAGPGEGESEVRSRPDAPDPAPVVLVVMDEIPLLSLLDGRGLIDAALYPNLAGLARDGVWFRNATAVSDDTRWAVPAIVSGQYPQPSLTPTQADYPHTLFTQLAPSHRLKVVEAITRLCRFAACNPPTTPVAARAAFLANDLRILYLHRLLTDDLRRTLPSLTTDWARWGVAGAAERKRRREEPRARRATKLQVATNFAGSISPQDGRPDFYFFHSLLPHSPWQWLPSGEVNATRSPIPDAGLPGVAESAWGVARYYQRHLLQAGVVDHVVGLTIQRLRDAGLYERALVIFAADHGVAFRPGLPRREFRDETAAEIMRVPLIVKFPAGERHVPGEIDIGGQRISDRNAETIDIAPTVLDVLGLEAASRTDGASLRRPLQDERPAKKIVFASGTASRSFGPDGPDMKPALVGKLAWFGTSENRFRVPRPSRFAGLVGRAVAGLAVQAGGGSAIIDRLSSFTDFRPTADATPFDVSGYLASKRDGEVTWVAVAVNGTIQAITRTWDADPPGWLATPPLDAWTIGRNHLEIFIVSGDEQRPVLLQTALSEAANGG